MAKHKQASMTAGFHTWLASVSEMYTQLTDQERNETLDQLIALSGPTQLHHLGKQVNQLLYRDFMQILPPEQREYLLSFVDGQSLLSCCIVNRYWNAAITSSPRIWLSACRRSGLVIDNDLDNCDGSYWKDLFFEMTKRRQQMKTYKAFHSKTFDRDLRRVTAVHYHKGKVAAASDSKTIRIWDCASSCCILNVRTDVSISCIRFDEQYLIAASYLGHMVLWDVSTGERLAEFMRHAGAIFSFDFSLHLNILVSGAADNRIKIWSLCDGKLYKTITDHTLWVLKVILTPYPAEEGSSHQEQHLVISMDKLQIYIRLMSFVSVASKPEGLYLTTIYSIPLNNSGDMCLFTPGLYFDGAHLLFVKNLDGMSSQAILCQWDVKERRLTKETNLKRKVKALVAVGEKYMAVLLPSGSKTVPNFVVLDRETLERVTFWSLPRNRFSSPDCGNFAFGEKSWLNGLDGKNDQGVLLALGTEDNNVYVLNWLPRSEPEVT